MKSKYRNRKVIVDGKVFHSKKEAARYKELLLLEKAGKIRDLKRQVEYLLIPAQFDMIVDENGKRKRVCLERSCSYKADFTYYEGEKFVVEDTKGVRTPDYVIKRKLMLQNWGIRILET